MNGVNTVSPGFDQRAMHTLDHVQLQRMDMPLFSSSGSVVAPNGKHAPNANVVPECEAYCLQIQCE